MKEVVAALLRQGNRFLICQRPADKARALLWEFVGGKVEPGETRPVALARECREELGVEIEVGEVFDDVLHVYNDMTVHLTVYEAQIVAGAPQRLEHNDLRWITPAEIPNYEFCQADQVILEKIIATAANTKLERPNILCHMVQSIDGKVTGAFLAQPETAEATNVYYALNRELRGDAYACGRVTMEESFTHGFYPDMTLFEDKKFPIEDYIAEPDAGFFAVAFDTHGRLGWKESRIVDDDPGYHDAHIIEVLCENVDPRYLAYMRRVGVSYIFAGAEELDLPLALHKLKTLFGIERLLLEGGSLLNGTFLREGFVDAISLVTAPVVAGEGKSLFEGVEGCAFTLAETKTYEGGVLWSYYAKKEED
ncbi:MAG: NUDIX domain-containing protein [Clostridia bacterium]|nr:NUDIX domain-containing protein [Clostridia bacterium]